MTARPLFCQPFFIAFSGIVVSQKDQFAYEARLPKNCFMIVPILAPCITPNPYRAVAFFFSYNHIGFDFVIPSSVVQYPGYPRNQKREYRVTVLQWLASSLEPAEHIAYAVPAVPAIKDPFSLNRVSGLRLSKFDPYQNSSYFFPVVVLSPSCQNADIYSQ